MGPNSYDILMKKLDELDGGWATKNAHNNKHHHIGLDPTGSVCVKAWVCLLHVDVMQRLRDWPNY